MGWSFRKCKRPKWEHLVGDTDSNKGGTQRTVARHRTRSAIRGRSAHPIRGGSLRGRPYAHTARERLGGRCIVLFLRKTNGVDIVTSQTPLIAGNVILQYPPILVNILTLDLGCLEFNVHDVNLIININAEVLDGRIVVRTQNFRPAHQQLQPCTDQIWRFQRYLPWDCGATCVER